MNGIFPRLELEMLECLRFDKGISLDSFQGIQPAVRLDCAL